jgi:adenylate cyclase
MALFATPDAAADAATRMHMAVNALPAVGDHKLAVRIGFHSGPVIQRDKDVFGDTVNLAARLVEQATKGQVLTSSDTVSLLSPAVRNNIRRLYDITVKGKANDVALCELLWQKSPDITQLPLGQSELKRPQSCIRIRYRGRELVCRRRVEWITIGRDPSSVFVISDVLGSRQHCVIERRQDRFWVRDYSSNGTYVTVEGQNTESMLRREELSLHGHGWLAFGQPKSKAVDLLEYWCE